MNKLHTSIRIPFTRWVLSFDYDDWGYLTKIIKLDLFDWKKLKQKWTVELYQVFDFTAETKREEQ